MAKKRRGHQSTLPLPFMLDTTEPKAAEDGNKAIVEVQASQSKPPTTEVSPLLVEYHRAFYDQRKDFLAAERETTKAYDKTMTTLAAGAFGLSITFVKQLAPNPVPGTMPWFYWSWSFFGLSLISIMCSHLFSMFGWRRAMAREDEAFRNEGVPPEGGNRWINITHVCNLLSLILLACGIFLFAIFAILNLQGV